MSGREWLKSFKRHYNHTIKDYEKSLKGHKESSGEWTKYIIGTVVEAVGDDLKCWVVSRETKDKKDRGEYLNIDALFFRKEAYKDKILLNSMYDDPNILPQVAIEHENIEDKFDKISYCLWKILCIRDAIKVLICYQSDSNQIEELRKHLEKIISHGKLMENERGDLLVIVGNEEYDDSEQPFEKYFSIFEWRNNKLKMVTG